MSRRALGWLWLAAYIATIFGANWAIDHDPDGVRVGFGEMAPAGVWFAGLAFTFRDLTQNTLGKDAVLVAIGTGAFLSWWISDAVTMPGGHVALAVASGLAFGFSELADFTVYTPLARRRWLGAVLLSNVVGLVIDSLLFLYLAFGNLDFLPGQVIGKAWMTLLAVAVLAPLRRRRELRPAPAAL